MTIGTRLKKLRRERDITQEQLAEYLGISAQAVSQWECDKTAPDISQLPLLAHVLDVSADEILGIYMRRNEDEIKRIIEEARRYIHESGDYKSAVKILKDALTKYPRSYRIMTFLADALSCVDLNSYAHVTGERGDAKKVTEEVSLLCQKVMEECVDNELRNEALRTIIYRYKNVGQRDKAVEYAEMMPLMGFSREEMLIGIYENDSDTAMLGNYISFCADRVMTCMGILAAKSEFSDDDKIRLLRQIIAIADTVYCDGDCNYYTHHVVSAYQTIAEIYVLRNDREEALSALEKMCMASILFDTYEGNAVNTSPAVRRIKQGRPIPWDENTCATLVKCLREEKWYDFLRGEPRFTEVQRQLEKYARISEQKTN